MKIDEVLPHFKKSIEERADSTCFGTGIAPVCAVLDLLDTEGGRVSWYVMRKIELPNERSLDELPFASFRYCKLCNDFLFSAFQTLSTPEKSLNIIEKDHCERR